MTAIAHGYTLTDLDRLARTATAAARTGDIDTGTCHGLAWSAIAEHLAAADTPPGSRELIRTGWQAINRELAACLHARGYQSSNTSSGAGASPRYWQYWHQRADDTAVDRMIDHLACVQIGATFTAAEADAVTALALHGDYQAAADALGITYKRLCARIAEARRRFRGAWYAPDTAPPAPRDKRRGTHPPRTHCGNGHAMAGDNLRERRRRGGKTERTCRTCERDRSATRWQKAAAA